MRHSMFMICLCVALAGCATVPDVVYREHIQGDQPGFSGDNFVRYDGYDNVAGTMQVSATHYRSADGEHTVTLLGAIHIGDGAYYAELQKLLDAADLVLYELVKPEAMEYPPEVVGPDPMYSGVADLFGLSLQMQEVDYAREHFRWLDMSAERFMVRITEILEQTVERLGDLFGVRTSGIAGRQTLRRGMLEARPEVRRALAAVLFQLGPCVGAETTLDPISLLMEIVLLPLRIEKGYYAVAKTEKMFEDKYKHAMAMDLVSPAAQDELLDQLGEANDPLSQILLDAIEQLGNLVLHERNQVVVDGIEELLASGELPARTTVFYGAAHNQGIAEGLGELGFTPCGGPEWIDSIAIRP